MSRFLYTQTKAGMTKDKYFTKDKVFFSPADPKQINDVYFFRQYNLELSCLYGKIIARAVSLHTRYTEYW